MYVALVGVLLTAVFLYLCREWASHIDVIPLNYIAEQRYRPAYTPTRVSTNDFAVFASSACMAVTATHIPYVTRGLRQRVWR